MNIRKIILKELKKQKLSKYKLAQLLSADMSQSIVYKYLAADCNISDDKLGVMLDALKLKIESIN
jgi:predicted transcriptional regulator